MGEMKVMKVPFLITKEELCDPIIGYNVISNCAQASELAENVESLKTSFGELSTSIYTSRT